MARDVVQHGRSPQAPEAAPTRLGRFFVGKTNPLAAIEIGVDSAGSTRCYARALPQAPPLRTPVVMPKKINVALVGLGFGAEFIPIYQRHPNAQMHAICQRTEKKLNAVGDAFGIAARYTDFAEMLKDPEIDLVHINSPIPDHGWQSIAALKAGKHVACTVPMATSIAECKQIVDLVKKTGLRYMMAETVVYAREYLYIEGAL